MISSRTDMVAEGLDVVVRDITFRAATARPRAAAIVVHQAAQVAQKMRDRVPIAEGDLLDSITSDTHATFDGTAVYADAGPDPSANDKAFVGPMIEKGTVKMGPQPFARPAGDAQLPLFLAAMRGMA